MFPNYYRESNPVSVRSRLFGSLPRNVDTGMLVILTALAVLQITDAVMTHTLVGFGLVREGNPFIAGVVNEGLFIPFKLATILISTALLLWLCRLLPLLAKSTAFVVVCFYCVVLWSNILTVL